MEISRDDFLMFIDRALDGMLRIVEELGEERSNMRPDLPGANSPYAILTHCSSQTGLVTRESRLSIGGGHPSYETDLLCCGARVPNGQATGIQTLLGMHWGVREVFRDRDAEFRASGTVVELRERVGELKSKLVADIEQVQGKKPLASAPNSLYNPLRSTDFGDWTEGTALIHAYEELAQHHGQMELTRDVLMGNYEGST